MRPRRSTASARPVPGLGVCSATYYRWKQPPVFATSSNTSGTRSLTPDGARVADTDWEEVAEEVSDHAFSGVAAVGDEVDDLVNEVGDPMPDVQVRVSARVTSAATKSATTLGNPTCQESALSASLLWPEGPTRGRYGVEAHGFRRAG